MLALLRLAAQSATGIGGSQRHDHADEATLNVHLVCKGERHTSNLWTAGMQDYDREQLTEHLVIEFSDFVAESRFGWGQQR